jgi:hypothetical protein
LLIRRGCAGKYIGVKLSPSNIAMLESSSRITKHSFCPSVIRRNIYLEEVGIYDIKLIFIINLSGI